MCEGAVPAHHNSDCPKKHQVLYLAGEVMYLELARPMLTEHHRKVMYLENLEIRIDAHCRHNWCKCLRDLVSRNFDLCRPSPICLSHAPNSPRPAAADGARLRDISSGYRSNMIRLRRLQACSMQVTRHNKALYVRLNSVVSLVFTRNGKFMDICDNRAGDNKASRSLSPI
jgi:hypothetical protein